MSHIYQQLCQHICVAIFYHFTQSQDFVESNITNGFWNSWISTDMIFFLSFPKVGMLLIVESDALVSAVETIVTQKRNICIHSTQYFMGTVSPAERNHCICKLDPVDVTYALRKFASSIFPYNRFNSFRTTKHFLIYSLQHLFTTTCIHDGLKKWVDFVAAKQLKE